MNALSRHLFLAGRRASPWTDTAPVREELFGIERLEQHAHSLAAAQSIIGEPPRVSSLHKRLNGNASVLLAAYRSSAAALRDGGAVAPAAEWLLDNYHLVEEHIREIREDLPPNYYRQLPKLTEGPFAGYPRVFGVAWAFVAHTDSYFDPKALTRFIAAYQQVQPLTIGELWAVAISVRIVLIENLRRLADQISAGRRDREDAQALADRLFAAGCARSALDEDIASRPQGPLSEVFAAQLAKCLRDRDPLTHPALDWLKQRLATQDSSIEWVVRHAQERMGASNLSVRNVITSLRLISSVDWADLVESVSLVDARLRAASSFQTLDFATRNLYRSAIEQLARGAHCAELEVVDQALYACSRAKAERERDPGFHLIAEGRPALETAIHFKPSMRLAVTRLQVRLGLGGYIGCAVLVTLLSMAVAYSLLSPMGAPAQLLWLLLALAIIPASELAIQLVNRAVTLSFGAVTLPGLSMLEDVPGELRTLIVVPTLLTSERDLLDQVQSLEVHYLSGPRGEVYLALLTDGLDAPQQQLDSDEPLLNSGRQAIAELNRRYPPGESGPRFLLLHRQRQYSHTQGCWMGRERKRGKLHQLNRLLRGASDTDYRAPCAVPANVRFVITLDADTRLPRDAVQRLIGKLAHPLNRPVLDADGRHLRHGHGILQPRVSLSSPTREHASLYLRVSSSPGGIDPYAAAISDVYQDLFGSGSYTGKGIYDVDAFEAALQGKVGDETMLSHDLFEGICATAALVSDIELIEAQPARYDQAATRQHRWTRGDWQLLPWLLGRNGGRLSALGRWKITDNLRRSLVAPCTLAALLVAWTLPLSSAWVATLWVLALGAVATFLPALAGIRRRKGSQLSRHVRNTLSDLGLAGGHVLLTVTLLPDQAGRMLDAIVRTLYRLSVSRRNLLEWTSAAQVAAGPSPTLAAAYRQMAAGVVGSLLASGALLWRQPELWPLILPFLLLWGASPAIAQWVSHPDREPPAEQLSPQQALQLRRITRRTWRYFETFVTAQEHHLPPDNFQEDPQPVIAHRTSPTNIGLYLLSAISARDFGWAGSLETLERLEATFAVLHDLPRHRGHFLNWYDTRTLQPLAPAYVSSVDSGNLAGHLIALANACEQWRDGVLPEPQQGLLDTVALAVEECPAPAVRALLEDMHERLEGPQPFATQQPALLRLAGKACMQQADSIWLAALQRALQEHARDRQSDTDLAPRLTAMAEQARQLTQAMDFAFLLDPDRKLLSIGYSVAERRLDSSCYDLLASEARLASLVAIAKGDVPSRHWFRLGRRSIPCGASAALVSWSGSMFEYLMPSLVMRAAPATLLAQTNRLIVARQRQYAQTLGLPWGMSESAYNARDLHFTYQYSNFGVPDLGLKRGLAENQVIAPYASALAAMVDAPAALHNLEALAQMGALGSYGFYEAVDFTATRVPEQQPLAVVRAYMAHHQGMSIVALLNVLQQGRMQERFHREPMVQACALLLQERPPRDVMPLQPRAQWTRPPATSVAQGQVERQLHGLPVQAPVTHLLCNSRYSVMLTGSGGGYSRWRDMAVTRWREDPTLDPWGSFIFVRTDEDSQPWSAARCMDEDSRVYGDVTFAEDHARFVQVRGPLTCTLEVLVSGEDDCEVRHLTLVNDGTQAQALELTSYAELVLAHASADIAHPAFSNVFVSTDYLPEFGALIAHRRPREADQPTLWAAHFAVLDADDVAIHPQYETDRAAFLGAGHALSRADALHTRQRLGNSVGDVLDPIFSLRHQVRLKPGQTATVAFWTVVAQSREALLGLIDKHHDRNAFERARTLAWTQAQVQLHHLAIDAGQASSFQAASAPLLYADRRWRSHAPDTALCRDTQALLWPLGISGNLPIVLVRIDDLEDLAQVQQLLRAHEYWRMKRLSVDLVIINERPASYLQDLQVEIDTALRSSQSRVGATTELGDGAVYALRKELLGPGCEALLVAAARIVLTARRGPLAQQLANRDFAPLASPATHWPAAVTRVASEPARLDEQALEFFNGLGGFAAAGREYVTCLEGNRSTPKPWINVIANPHFGFHVSARGSGFTWSRNSRENALTPWSNDPVSDPVGEALYVRDEDSGELFAPTVAPLGGAGQHVARHGFGYSRFSHQAHDIAMDLVQFVPLDDPLKVSRLALHNRSSRPRHLSISAYAEWVLGSSRSATAPFIVSHRDRDSGALFAQNSWNSPFPEAVAFSDLVGLQTAWTADRSEFLGPLGSHAAPAALLSRQPLSGSTGSGFDPCAVLQYNVRLAPGERVEIVWLLGQGQSLQHARELVARYRRLPLDEVFDRVQQHWQQTLGSIQVTSPDRALDIMLNGWLQYQTLSCRLWARAGFYQASGAYGFRDQLQDGMALHLACPQRVREHLLHAAGRQFQEGDVQHWWLPHSGVGVRTHISDDRVWLAYATARYVSACDDPGILDEPVAYLDGPPLAPERPDAFFKPAISERQASVYEHAALGLDHALAHCGVLGLPLIGTGDWNDGMNRVGHRHRGESVWLGWFLLTTLALFIPLARERDPVRALQWQQQHARLQSALQTHAWDGQWYRRATFDDGTWLGSATSRECRIDSIAQSWAVLSGAVPEQRARTAMRSMATWLVRPDDDLVLLFTPPFAESAHDPGYLMAYPPGIRENGGQYSHAAMWAVLAFARLGQGDEALALMTRLNPINHSLDPVQALRYGVEPYVVAADIYSVAPHLGRGGWTWYTGAASWMYQAGVDGILGLRREGAQLLLAPCLARHWPGYSAVVKVADSEYSIEVRRLSPGAGESAQCLLDGHRIDMHLGCSRLPLDGGRHTVSMIV